MAGLSLEIVENLRPLLTKYCDAAGSLPSASGLRKTYLQHCFEYHVNELQEFVKDKKVAVVFDETGLMDWAVLNILFSKYILFISLTCGYQSKQHSWFSLVLWFLFLAGLY